MFYRTDKMREELKKNDEKIELMKKLRNEEIYNTIKAIEEKYNNKLNILNYEKNKINNVIYLDGFLSMDAIEYIVNEIEDKEYKQVTIPVKYKGRYLQKMGESYLNNDFYVCGLTDNENKIEIKKDKLYTEEELNQDFNHFYRLFHYNRKFGGASISVNYLADTYQKYCNSMSSNVESCLLDNKFPYIKDFIKMVIDYKLDKPDYQINVQEMQSLAEKFVQEYKDKKILSKRNEVNYGK